MQSTMDLPAQWRNLEEIFQAKGFDWAYGQLPSGLQPRRYTGQEKNFDFGLLYPAGYRDFVAACGYPWLTISSSCRNGLVFLPPAWSVEQSVSALGDPAYGWSEVKADRQKGVYQYRYVMFAFDAGWQDTNGFCFGPASNGEGISVWRVIESLPEQELGSFEQWFSQQIAKMSRWASKLKGPRRMDLSGGPFDILRHSLSVYFDGRHSLLERAQKILGAAAQDAKELDFSDCNMGVVPAEVRVFRQACGLKLEGNKLQHLPAEIGSLENLIELDLRWNPLQGLPAEIGKLQKLKTLILANTEISALPAEIGCLTSLEYLDLTNCEKLRDVPASIESMPSLKTLSLYSTNIPKSRLEALKAALPQCKVNFHSGEF